MARKIAGWIAGPIGGELPFFCLMVFALFFSHFLWSITPGGVRGLSLMQWRNVGIAFSAPVFMAWGLCVLLHGCRRAGLRRSLKVLLYALASLLMLADLLLLWGFGTLLSPWMLMLLAETNGNEACEFLTQNLLTANSMKAYGLLLLYGLTAFALERRWRGGTLSLPRQSAVAVAVAPFLAVGAYLFLLTARLPLLRTQYDFEAWHERRGFYAKQCTPTNLLYSALYLRVTRQDNALAIRSSQQAFRQPATCAEGDTLCVVLVIGESFSKWHTPLYGYDLATTPRLCALRDSGNLFVFSDAVTPYNLTTFSVKNILSTNSLADGEPWHARPALPVIFKKAGFHVSVWDNQRPGGADVSTYDYALGSYMYAPQMLPIAYDEWNTSTYTYDGDLVEAQRQRLGQQQASGHSHRLSLHIVHLMGQHSDAACRFPHTEGMLAFGPEDIRRTDLSEAERQAVADYDNATRYNDLVVGRIVDTFKEKPAVMLYVSDHGEEVYDYRHFLGRSHEHRKSREALRCQYEIPFLVWCSDRYMEAHPGQVEAIRKAQEKPLSADDLAHTLFSLAAIATPYYQSRHDVLSHDYVPGPRIVGGSTGYDNCY